MTRLRPLLPIGLLIGLATAPVLAANAQAPATGRLLVASGTIDDPSFSETVVLLLHHGEDGSLGVFLNRPTWVDPSEAFADAEPLAGYDGTLYFGGPIGPTQLLMLIDVDGNAPDALTPIIGSVFISTDIGMLEDLEASSSTRQLRLYAGHAAWGPGQLENEVEAGNWRVVRARPELVFPSDPERLWNSLPAGSAGTSARLAPAEPALTPSRPYRADPSTSRFPTASRD
ncbi:MAG: YqgE/AlgH family protein [Gammaproteobacteria bacterium]|nr:YqgE/AlgH family protein [Gammaproteobacteria bacterium]